MWKQTRCTQHQEESTILPWILAYTHNELHDTQSCAGFIIMLLYNVINHSLIGKTR